MAEEIQNEMILSRVKSLLTGKEYYIGVKGSVESVVVKMDADSSVDWPSTTVYGYIYDTTTKTITMHPDENGQCQFEVEHGLKYAVKLPKINTFVQGSATYNYTSSLATRMVSRYYSKSVDYETLTVTCSVISSNGQDSTLLNGKTVYANCTDGESYSAVFSGVSAQIKIPYGKTYSLTFPEVAGYGHNMTNNSYVSGNITRGVTVTYHDYSTASIWGVDTNGNTYTINDNGMFQNEDGTELTAETAAATLVALAFNPSALAEAERQDGTGKGCGFMIKIASEVSNRQWCVQNVNFYNSDETKGSPALSFVQNDSVGLTKCDGAYYTREIIRAGRIVNASWLNTYPTGEPTPAAAYATSCKMTINGVEKTGYLPGYGQLRRLALNKAYLNIAYTAMGKTAPNITSGNWWTSCQSSETYSVNLGNGSFDSNGKAHSISVLPVYEI